MNITVTTKEGQTEKHYLNVPDGSDVLIECEHGLVERLQMSRAALSDDGSFRPSPNWELRIDLAVDSLGLKESKI